MKKKKKSFIGYDVVAALLAIIIMISIVSRTIPDGTARLNLGKSHAGEKVIALTFDDGPGGYTEKLLDGLAEYNAQATFFVIGKNVERNPDIVLRAYEEGHLIGNHTYDHPRLIFMSSEKAKENIDKSARIIASVTGEKPFFVRAPYGYITSHQLKTLDTFFVSWSVDTYDWKKSNSEDDIYNCIMKNASDGEIILLHDTREKTVNAVLRAIPELQAQGYEFVRVDDLLTRNGNKLAKGIPYRKCEFDKNPIAY